MTLQECYIQMGAVYDEVEKRLMKPERIYKYLVKFADDESFLKMKAALAQKDWENAFLYAHALKGVSMNLGLGKLEQTSQILCDALRKGEPSVDITPLFADVDGCYEKVMAAIGQLRQSEAASRE